MFYIEYTELGKAVSDFELESELEYIKQEIIAWYDYFFSYESDKYLQYSTSNIFNLLMLKIAQQEIDSDIIMFRYNDKAVPVNVTLDKLHILWYNE